MEIPRKKEMRQLIKDPKTKAEVKLGVTGAGFDFYLDKCIKICNSVNGGPNRYLSYDGNSTEITVAPDTNNQSSIIWLVIKNDENNYSLQSMSYGDNPFLDVDPTGQGRVHGSPWYNTDSLGGTCWSIIPSYVYANCFVFQTRASGKYNFLDCNTTTGEVYNSESTNIGRFPGTHWLVETVQGSINGQYAENLIVSSFQGLPDFPIYLSDQFQYNLVDLNVVEYVFYKSGLGDIKFTREKFDCDDYSICFKAAFSRFCQENPTKHPFAVGIIWGRLNNEQREYHVFNFFVDYDLNLVLFEPQTGRIIRHNEIASVTFVLF